MRLLRGEDLDVLSGELKVTAQTLSAWREGFLAGGEANLKSRRPDATDDEVKGRKAMVGDLTLRLESSREAMRRLKAGDPWARGRSRS